MCFGTACLCSTKRLEQCIDILAAFDGRYHQLSLNGSSLFATDAQGDSFSAIPRNIWGAYQMPINGQSAETDTDCNFTAYAYVPGLYFDGLDSTTRQAKSQTSSQAASWAARSALPGASPDPPSPRE